MLNSQHGVSFHSTFFSYLNKEHTKFWYKNQYKKKYSSILIIHINIEKKNHLQKM